MKYNVRFAKIAAVVCSEVTLKDVSKINSDTQNRPYANEAHNSWIPQTYRTGVL